MNIGIFGGTFNPIHVAHLYIAEELRESMGLDLVVFVPAAVPPHKEVEYKVSAEHRLKMVELAIADNPAFKVSDVELKLPIPSYSYKTIQRFQEEYGDKARLYFLMGMDSFLDIGTWHSVDRLLEMCDFVTVFRPGTDQKGLTSHKYVREIDVVMLDELNQRVRCVGKVELASGRYLWLVASLGMEVSSTETTVASHLRETGSSMMSTAIPAA